MRPLRNGPVEQALHIIEKSGKKPKVSLLRFEVTSSLASRPTPSPSFEMTLLSRHRCHLKGDSRESIAERKAAAFRRAVVYFVFIGTKVLTCSRLVRR